MSRELMGMGWREFSAFVGGLLCSDTRLYRVLHPSKDSAGKVADDEW